MKRLILLPLFLLTLPSAHGMPARDFIVGGENVTRRDPVGDSTVGIFSPNPDGRTGALCTGTLIRKDIALTAAHCISPGAKPVLIFDRDLHAPGAAHRRAEGVAVNPAWRARAGHGMDQGDIALVKFGGSLPDGYHVIPTVGSDAAIRKGQKVTLAGYGITNAATHAGAGRLRKTQVSVLNNRPGRSEMILDQSHGHGACHGDSGGPAYVRNGNRVALAGLTNRSYPDSAPDDCAHQVVYTKVPAYKSWIEKNEKKLESVPAAEPSMKGAGRGFRGHVHLKRASARAKRAVRSARAKKALRPVRRPAAVKRKTRSPGRPRHPHHR